MTTFINDDNPGCDRCGSADAIGRSQTQLVCEGCLEPGETVKLFELPRYQEVTYNLDAARWDACGCPPAPRTDTPSA
jgi:hypothetical protein